MLTNLLTNAVAHAYDEGQAGQLSIRVSEPRQDTVRIVFSDDGKGIPPENIGKVFDPFFTTGRSSGSTGLGLHIVYNLVTSRLQGHINLYSKVGTGTRFTIDIPKAVAEARAGRSAGAAPAARREPEHADCGCARLPAALVLCGAAGRGEDAGLLLGGQSGIAQPADRHHDDRHQCRAAVLQQSGRVSARLDRDRVRRSRRSGRSPTTGWNTPSISATA